MAVAHAVALDIHPVNNLRVLGQLKQRFEASAEDCQAWMQHWMCAGFEAVEKLLPDDDGFAFGKYPGIVDLCIVAQMYNAHRWGVDLTPFPKVVRIEQHCLELPEIFAAHPDQQPEAQEVS